GIAEEGAAGGPKQVMQLYDQALNDLYANHCNGDLRVKSDLEREITKLKSSFPTWRQPEWVTAWLRGPPGSLERSTARKVGVYVGHGVGQLIGSEIQELRARLEVDFPRARTVIYKYELPEAHRGDEDQPKGRRPNPLGTRLKSWLFQPLEDEAPKLRTPRPRPRPSVIEPLKAHVAVFLIDSVETEAVYRFSR